MKKSFFLLFSAAILFGFNAKAQSANTSSSASGTISPALGGEWSVIIVVSDSRSKPVSGAKVTLPCSGQSFQVTDATGKVDFVGAGSCPCTSSNANIQTTKSNVNRAVSCGTNNVTLPQ